MFLKKVSVLVAGVGCLILGVSSQANSQAQQLNVYTYDSFISEWGPGPKIEQAFEARCECDLNFIAVEDGVSILNRLRIEGKRTKADVILGIDDAILEEARGTGLIANHDVDTSLLKDELAWQDKQFLPFDMGYFAFIYNSEKIDKPATSLKQLIESDASVIYQDPRTSTPGMGLMLWVKSVYGDGAAKAWIELGSHTVTVTKGWWEAYSMFLEGGSDYVLSYTSSPAYHVVAEGESKYLAAEFSEGHVAQVEVAAVINTSDKQTLGREFLAFLVSDEAQKILPVTNWMLPVRDSIELPDIFHQLVTPKRIGFSSLEVAESRKAWLKEWRNAAAQ